MMKRALFLTLAASLTILTMVACSPQKYTAKSIKPCSLSSSGGFFEISRSGVPYTTLSPDNCVAAIKPFDLSIWHESPMASYKVRGDKISELGCRPLTEAVDNCTYCGVPGSSNTLLMNFNPSVYPQNAKVKRAVLAIYSPGQAQGLKDSNLRGRFSVGGELVSLAQKRDIMASESKNPGAGWVLFDITFFVARAINERRSSIHFEISVPCQTPATNLVTVGVNRNEPKLLVEFN